METVDMRPSGMVLNIEKGQWQKIRGLFDPFLIKGLKYPVRNKSH